MILSLSEVKQHLRIDFDDDDNYLLLLIASAEQFLKNTTGKTFDITNALAKTACLLLVADLYEKRTLATDKASEKIRDIVTMILTQLAVGGDSP